MFPFGSSLLMQASNAGIVCPSVKISRAIYDVEEATANAFDIIVQNKVKFISHLNLVKKEKCII